MRLLVLTLILRYFNSIKVRLKQYTHIRLLLSPQLFQFHKGTIKTNYPGEPPIGRNTFQFHKGTIKTQEKLYKEKSYEISIP